MAHTRGGSRAGYQRWRDFKKSGLKGYARRRNNPLADGASRMSAYLHYGMVSPFRLAREAYADGSAGAEKYLDELMIWRELAYAYCYHHPNHNLFFQLIVILKFITKLRWRNICISYDAV